MSRFVKELMTKDFENKFKGVTEFVVVDITGIDGNSNNELRGQLGEKGMKLTVVRNSLMRAALKNAGLESAGDLFAAGPRTVVYGGDNAVDVAKELEGLMKKYKVVTLKGAYVDGQIMDENAAKSLAKMKSRVELQADVIMLAQSPGRNLAGAIAAPASNIAGCIKTIIENLEDAA